MKRYIRLALAPILAMVAAHGCSRANADGPTADAADAAGAVVDTAALADTGGGAEPNDVGGGVDTAGAVDAAGLADVTGGMDTGGTGDAGGAVDAGGGVDTAGGADTTGGPDTTGTVDTTEALDVTGEADTDAGGPGPTTCHRPNPFDDEDMLADVAYLASAALGGRVPGSAGDAAARKFVADRFACLGIEAPSGMSGYEQPFTNGEGQATANVLAVIPGVDAAVSDEVVVVSAHTDHLGGGKLGANDDASGVAGLLAIADALTSGNAAPKRTVLLAAFGSEEPGFEGSEYFVTHAPTGLGAAHIVLSVNMDMIGSYTAGGSVWALGAFDGTKATQLVKDAAPPALEVGYGEGSEESDNVTFCSRGIPYLFFWTEDEACYHQTCDTVDRIDAPHMATIARLVHDVTRAAADAPKSAAPRRKPGVDVCLEP